MNKQLLLSLLRHVLTASGSMIAAKGLADSGTIEAVSGGIMALIGFLLFRGDKPTPPPGAVAALMACLLCGCVVNRPVLRETMSYGGTNTTKELRITSFAIWPATQDIGRQKASLGKTFTVGQTDIREDAGGNTNALDALKALDSILGKIRP